jgi:nucleotide-binding universal stress UspA family protein
MPTFKHILFPVDFSERCRAVEPFVKSAAQHFQANLTLLHAVPNPVTLAGGFEAPPYAVITDIKPVIDAAKDRLSTILNMPELQTVRVVESGDPAFLITDFAKHNDVDLIMMPTHGYGGFRAYLIGSVVAKVLHDARCAVWTAAHTAQEELGTSAEYKSILCAIDLDSEGVNLLRFGADLAKQYGATLRVAHAVPASEARPLKYLDSEFRQELLKESRAEIGRMQQEAGTDAEICLEAGDVSKAVRAAALQYQANLVIIGRGKIHETFGRLRTNAYAIVRDSPCPVLSI